MHNLDDSADCLTSVLTSEEAGKLYNLSRNAISDACRRGALRGRRSGRLWLVTVADLVAYKRGRYYPAAIPPELKPAFERAHAAFMAEATR